MICLCIAFVGDLTSIAVMTDVSQVVFLKRKVCALLELGFSLRSASKRLGPPYTTVNGWFGQDFRLSRKSGSGRPRKTSSRTDRLIIRLAKANPLLSLTEMAAVVYFSVSLATVRRLLFE